MYDRSQTSERRAGPQRSGPVVLACVLAVSLAACLKVAAPAASPAAGPLTQTPDGRPLQMTFEDTFDSFRPYRDGHGVWRTEFKDGRSGDPFELRTISSNNELQLYVDNTMRVGASGSSEAAAALDPFVVHDGVLEITARPTPSGLSRALGGFRYTSGLITTQPTFTQTYGYFEMRAKLPRGKGVWPAFWMLPADLGWPPEIDVMESIGDPAFVWTTAHSKSGANRPGVKHAVAPDAFHTFAVSWDAKQLVWFVDGREIDRQPTPPDMHQPMYLLANVAVGGNWPGAPDATTTFPASMSIDYIRAYRFAP